MADDFREAFVEWARAFETPHQIDDIKDLTDGQVLFDILVHVDSQYFKNPRTSEASSSDNWVLKYNAIKRLYSLVSHFYADCLGQSIAGSIEPNLQAIAKDQDANDTIKLCQLVLALAVQCENNQFYIEHIQNLKQTTQHALMLSIEQVMSEVGRTGNDKNVSNGDAEEIGGMHHEQVQAETVKIRQQYDDLVQQHETLLNEHKRLQTAHEDSVAEKDELNGRINDLEKSLQANQTGKADVFYRTEIENLRSELSRAENTIAEKDKALEKQLRLVEESSKTIDDLRVKADEATRLKDQIDEYKHAADKLQKTENVIEKYRKKLEESADLRRQMKGLEDQNAGLVAKNSQLEQEYQKLVAYKSLTDSYKVQIARLEEMNAELTKAKNSVEFDMKTLMARVEQLGTVHVRDMEQINLLQDKIKELELGGKRGLNKELGDEDNQISGALDDALTGTTMTDLKLKIAKLERELRQVEDEKTGGAASKVIVLENLLEDANRLKGKFEDDYLKEHQEKLVLENELNRIRAGSSSFGDGPEMSLSLRKRLNEYEQELSELKLKFSELKIKYEQSEKELVVSKSDLNLVGKDKLDALASLKENNTTEVHKLQEQVKIKDTRISTLEEEKALQLQQLNKVLLEKDVLQSQFIQDRDKLFEKERSNRELQESLTAVSSANDESVRGQMVQLQEKNTILQEQINYMQTKLQNAKEFIKQQDILLKEASNMKSESTEEVFNKLKKEISSKDEEINDLKKQKAERELRFRREQELMISAWHNMGSRIQRDNVAFQRASSATPTSWLGQQRKSVESSQLRRR